MAVGQSASGAMCHGRCNRLTPVPGASGGGVDQSRCIVCGENQGNEGVSLKKSDGEVGGPNKAGDLGQQRDEVGKIARALLRWGAFEVGWALCGGGSRTCGQRR